MLSVPIKKEKKREENFKLHSSFTSFGRDPPPPPPHPMSIHEFGGLNPVCTFGGDITSHMFPYGPMLTKTMVPR